MYKIKAFAFVFLFIAMMISVAGCGVNADKSVLHESGSSGYIEYERKNLPLRLKSKQAFVYSVSDDKYLYSKGKGFKVQPASTAKLLTILCALDYLDPEEIITPGEELDFVREGSSLAYIRPGHKLTAEQLIAGMLLPSGNDAAYVLAAAAGKKILGVNGEVDAKTAVKSFVEKMNLRAVEIGMCGSHFDSPDGFPSDGTYSTVEDMCVLSIEASRNPIISKYAKIYKYSVTYASGHVNEWKNTNKLLDPDCKYYISGADGLKTGTASMRNSCLIATINVDGERYIIGLFAGTRKNFRFEDACSVVKYIRSEKK